MSTATPTEAAPLATSDPSARPLRARLTAALSDRAAVAKCAIGLVAILVALDGFWRTRLAYLTFVDNSDLLYLPALYRDLFSHHVYALRGWWLTPAPYFFPDMPMFFLASALTPNIASAYCLYEAFTLLALLGCFYWIAGVFTRSRADRILAVGLVGLLMFVFCRPTDLQYWYFAKWLLAPSAHGGGVLAGLLLLGLGLRMLERVTFPAYVAFALLSFAGIVSDNLVFVHYSLPFLAAAWCAAVFRRTRFIPVLLMTLLSGAAWYGARSFVEWSNTRGPFHIPTILPIMGTRDQILTTWKAFAADWQKVTGPGSGRALLTLLYLSLFATGAFVVNDIATRKRNPQPSAHHFRRLALIAAASLAASLALPILYCSWGNSDCVRYLLPYFAFPLLLLAICAVRLIQAARSSSVIAVGVVFLLVGVVFASPAATLPAVDNSTVFYTPDVQFIDRVHQKYNLHNGVAGYWVSKPATLFSKDGVVINTLEYVGDEDYPRFWINNPNHWCQTPDGKPDQYPIYDFAVCPMLDEGQLRAQFGDPAAVEEWAGWKVLIYNRPSDVLFRMLGRAESLGAADRRPLHRIVKPRYLNWPKDIGTPWNYYHARIIPPGKSLELHLDAPDAADVLKVMTHCPFTYQIELRLQGDHVGECAVPPVKGWGLHYHDVALAPVTHGAPFDTIIITPPAGPGDYSVGYVGVFDDPVLHPAPPARSKSPRKR